MTSLLHTSIFSSDTPGETAVPFPSSSLVKSLLNEYPSVLLWIVE